MHQRHVTSSCRETPRADQRSTKVQQSGWSLVSLTSLICELSFNRLLTVREAGATRIACNIRGRMKPCTTRSAHEIPDAEHSNHYRGMGARPRNGTDHGNSIGLVDIEFKYQNGIAMFSLTCMTVSVASFQSASRSGLPG